MLSAARWASCTCQKMTASTLTGTVSRVSACSALNCVVWMRSSITAVTLSSTGMIRNSPGPFTLDNLPARRITKRSQLFAILSEKAVSTARISKPAPGAGLLILAVLTAFSLKMANNWERFVILRAGKLSSVKGPGLFVIIPVIDAIAAVIDERIQTTQFNAEQALTRDTVPVNVDAVIFWHVHDAQRAALNITDYRQAIDRVAQTSLREMIGASLLSALLAERKSADEVLR